MFSRTCARFFYKNDRTRRLSNPMRRWVYHYIIFGSLGATALYVGGKYQLAKYEAVRSPGSPDRLCSSGILDLLYVLPFNMISNSLGRLSESPYVPREMHHRGIEWLTWYYNVDMTDCATEDFETMQDFFVRKWKPGARPVHAEAPLVSPCDGVILAVQDDVRDGLMVQVKGLSHSVSSLFRCNEYPPVAPGRRRVAVTLSLRTQDYHHIISPCTFSCAEAVYVPGYLLPNNAAGFHWIPGLLKVNERVVLRGYRNSNPTEPVYMALVGGTLTGRIDVHFDSRIVTNNLDPPAYAIRRPYKTAHPLGKGEDVATFRWGSAVVILVDLPQNATLCRAVGETVRAGEPLVSDTLDRPS